MSAQGKWEIVIGLETHAQLSTVSKIFSGASTAFGAAPNTQASAVDVALPGVLPVANKGAVERAIRFGIAIGGTINRRSVFARKNYFYPDLPKGYQISQYELPVVQGGSLSIFTKEGEKTVQLTRAHLEEDAGKSLHEGLGSHSVLGHGMSGIDLNRAGTPLLEIVSEPDMRSSEEAVAYAKALHGLVRWIGICDGNMQEGSFRCDANVSVRRFGEPLGTRREIKNLNSFRFLQQAIDYEAKWQIETLEEGGKIQQATVLFDPDKGETRAMRTKEDAHDYRYFPDPDLPPLVVSEEWIARVRGELPELPQAKRERYQNEYGLSEYDATQLTQSLEIATYFEEVVHHRDLRHFDMRLIAKRAANLILGRVLEEIAKSGVPIGDLPIQPGGLAGIIELVLSNQIPASTANTAVFAEVMSAGNKTIASLLSNAPNHPKITSVLLTRAQDDIFKLGSNSTVTASLAITLADLWPSEDPAELERIVDKVIAANSNQVADYRAGKEKALNSLMGQVMKASKGKANPAQVNDILKKKLGA